MSKTNRPNPNYCYECKNNIYDKTTAVKTDTIPYTFCSQKCNDNWKKENCTIECKECKNKICEKEVRLLEGRDSICFKCYKDYLKNNTQLSCCVIT